jgi:nitrate reductase (cytochrome)
MTTMHTNRSAMRSATSSDRRAFIKSTAMAAATAALAANTGRSFALPVIDNARVDDRGVKWDKAPCRFCGTGCHVQVGVKDGRIVAIAGDVKADVNRGLLCVKGYHVGKVLYGKDRLTKPMLKRGDRYVEISWDEAIDIIADKILEAPDRFGLYGSGQWTIGEGCAANKFMKAGLGSNQIDGNPRLCMSSAVTGFLSCYGVDEPAGCYDDLDACDVLIMWGNNPAEMHPVLFSRVTDRRAKGEDILCIDISTRRTRTTDQCQEYLEMKPHGDLAIANGIAHMLIKNGTYSQKFVEQYCNFRQLDPDNPGNMYGMTMSFEEYSSALEKYTPEHVEELSGIPADKIRMLGDLFGDPSKKITSLWCMGMNQHTRGTAINCLVHSIHFLSGHFGTPGDSPTSLTGQPSACGTVREVGTLCHLLPGGRVVMNAEHRADAEDLWNVPRGRIPARPGYHTVAMFDHFCSPSDRPGALDTLWVQVTNPGQTLPNLHKLFNRKKELENKFLIVSDVYPTATTALADLILPAAMWVEKNGMYGNSERRTQHWWKMVDPPGDARDDCWMTIAVAHRLMEKGHEGMKGKDGRFIFHIEDENGSVVPIWKWEHYYDVNVDRHLFEEYRKFTPYKQKDLAPYEEYVRERGLRWPVVQQPDGTWRETRFRFSGFDDPYVKDGREYQFYNSVTKDDRALIWFRPHEFPPEMPDEEYPFWLNTGRVLEHWHTGTMTRRIPELQRAVPRAYAELHAADARELGIHRGDIVRIESRRGKMDLPVWINGRGKPPRGQVFVPFFDETMLINEVTLHEHDPFSFQPDYKKCAVRVSRSPMNRT